jgi:hypothetical protein
MIYRKLDMFAIDHVDPISFMDIDQVHMIAETLSAIPTTRDPV